MSTRKLCKYCDQFAYSGPMPAFETEEQAEAYFAAADIITTWTKDCKQCRKHQAKLAAKRKARAAERKAHPNPALDRVEARKAQYDEWVKDHGRSPRKNSRDIFERMFAAFIKAYPEAKRRAIEGESI